jgi:hypothetical protein
MQLALAFRPYPRVVVEHVVDTVCPDGSVHCNRCGKVLMHYKGSRPDYSKGPVTLLEFAGHIILWAEGGVRCRFRVQCGQANPPGILIHGLGRLDARVKAIYVKGASSETLVTGNYLGGAL